MYYLLEDMNINFINWLKEQTYWIIVVDAEDGYTFLWTINEDGLWKWKEIIHHESRI
jgi:hypothetical protein